MSVRMSALEIVTAGVVMIVASPAMAATTLSPMYYEATNSQTCAQAGLYTCAVTFPPVTDLANLSVTTLSCSVNIADTNGLVLTSTLSDGRTHQNLKQTPQVTDKAGDQKYVFLEAVGRFAVSGSVGPSVTIQVRSTAATTLTCSMSGTLEAR